MNYTDLFIDKTKNGKKIPTNEYHSTGKHPIVDQGKACYAGYTDLEDGLFTDIPALVFGDHTRVIKLVEEPFFLGADGTKIIKAIDENANYNYLYYLLKSINIPNTGYNRHYKWLKTSEFEVHSPRMQSVISDNLILTEQLISRYKKELTLLDSLVKSRFVEMFGEPHINPMGWVIHPLSDVLNVIGGYAFKSTEFDEDHGIPVLRIGNINTGHFKRVNMVYRKEDSNLNRYLLYPGDLVMSLTGTVGKDDYGNVCILRDDFDKYYLNQRNAKLEIKKEVDKHYLSELLSFDMIKKRLTGINRGIRQANISNKDILELRVPIPPISLQKEYGFFVEEIDKSKSVIQKSLDEAQLLFDSLMQEYFG